MLVRDDWTLFCSRDYAARHGVPTTREELARHSIIGGGGSGTWRAYSAWLEQLGLLDRVSMSYDGTSGLLSGIKSGLGIGVLPCLVGRSDPDLVQCIPPPRTHRRKLWLLTHERVKQRPAVRVVIDFLYQRLSRLVREMEAAEVSPGPPLLRAVP
jgi:DNA-binding transcriptional LysR family regulator